MRRPRKSTVHRIEPLERRILVSASLIADAFTYPLGDFSDAGLSLNGGAAI
jgi:hypothetical protein